MLQLIKTTSNRRPRWILLLQHDNLNQARLCLYMFAFNSFHSTSLALVMGDMSTCPWTYLYLHISLILLSLAFLNDCSGTSSGERGDEIVARLKRDLLPTLRNGLLYWPACDFATYKFVLVHPQVYMGPFLSYI